MTFIRHKLRHTANASIPEHWQWHVQQTEIGWKTVPHCSTRTCSSKAVVTESVVCVREREHLSAADLIRHSKMRWMSSDRYVGAWPNSDSQTLQATLNSSRQMTGSQWRLLWNWSDMISLCSLWDEVGSSVLHGLYLTWFSATDAEFCWCTITKSNGPSCQWMYQAKHNTLLRGNEAAYVSRVIVCVDTEKASRTCYS